MFRNGASVPITIAIVDPRLSERVELNPVYQKVAKGVGKSISLDLDKIIVAKGMTVTGPFESLDYTTYPDKRNADLSLTPEVFINVQSRDLGNWDQVRYDRVVLSKSVEIKVDAWVTLMLREPMSSEKIWIKKIQVDEMSEATNIIAEKVWVGVSRANPSGFQPRTTVYDGRIDAVADIVKKMYPKIMTTVWRYLHTRVTYLALHSLSVFGFASLTGCFATGFTAISVTVLAARLPLSSRSAPER